MPTFGSLFAGIGGIDLGLERAGWTGRWQVEWDPFCQHVLAHHWPDVPRYGDITRVDWSTVEPVDLIAGGFPCQPFSFAGKQRGVEDERWLWPEFARAIRELRPRYVLVENVPGLLARRGGMGHVLGDLAALGYDAEWDSIPAAAVGAPHLRYRVWVVAYAHGESEPRLPFDGIARPRLVVEDADRSTVESRRRRRGTSEAGELADASSGGWDVTSAPEAREHQGQRTQPARGRGGAAPMGYADSAPADTHTASGRSWRAASEPGWWRAEPAVGRVADGVPARVDRLRALGNAVVPQIPELIGRRLLELMAEAAA